MKVCGARKYRESDGIQTTVRRGDFPDIGLLYLRLIYKALVGKIQTIDAAK